YHVIVPNSLSRSYKKNLTQMMLNLYEKTNNFLDTNLLIEYKPRLYNFIKRTSIDILYNASIANYSEFKVAYKMLTSNNLVSISYKNNDKLYSAFYYKLFYFLSKHNFK